MAVLLAEARQHLHQRMFESDTLAVSQNDTASNADSSSLQSKAIARTIIDLIAAQLNLKVHVVSKLSGQTLGKQFEQLIMAFLKDTFPKLQALRPGKWTIMQLGNNNKLKISDFAQYEHLDYLNKLTSQNSMLAAALGNDYLVAPDIVIYRDLYTDAELNKHIRVVDAKLGQMAAIRQNNNGKPVLHASVSVKFTMRSDRAQNSRTEALNLTNAA